MKKAILLLLLVFTTGLVAQTTKKEKLKFVEIKQNAKLKGKGYQLILKEVISDSRCPEGVTCIWAGEVQFVVSVYKDKKIVQDETITLSPKQNQDIKAWFSKYMPSCKKNIKSIGVLPYPKDGSVINPKDYYVKIGYIK